MLPASFTEAESLPNVHKPMTNRLLTVEQLAAQYGISLPPMHQLPASYTLRMWLTRKLATMHGTHKQAWQRIKQDPAKLQHNRDANRLRVQQWRQRKRSARKCVPPCSVVHMPAPATQDCMLLMRPACYTKV